ncbi:MAG: hypothetical protein CL431_09440 [Acidimicrobiaceae bacterium]|jgi:16S rRNA (uracil1498-N3)-methyltransferase|nr:hypothetical protein [Acidimicrobiaceae bacterium]
MLSQLKNDARTKKMNKDLGSLHELGLPHIFLDDLDVPTLSKSHFHHIKDVKRIKSGTHLTATDGKGHWKLFEFDESTLNPIGPKHHCEAPKITSAIYISITKSGKPDLVTQKLTELGVGSINFFFSDRSVPKWDNEKILKNKKKLMVISRLALAQSKGIWLPQLTVGGTFEMLVKDTGVALAQQSASKLAKGVRSVAIGPEGGWSKEELASNNKKYSIHRSNLRAETAAIAVGALLESYRS